MALDKRLVSVVGAGVAATLLAFVPNWEGTVLKTYRDPVGIVTACEGHVDASLKMGQAFTPEQCSEMLASDLTIASHGVQDCLTAPLSDNELAAYISAAFNIGVDAFCGSSMARKVNAGDHAGACASLSLWTYSQGHQLPGLVRRRAAERHLCETP